MKCDELEPIELECNMGKDSVTGLVNREPWKAYDIDEVDAAIAELKAENKMLKEHIANGDVSRITLIDEATKLKAENERLKDELNTANNQCENLINSATDIMLRQDKVNDSKCTEIKSLKRALWIARAKRAIEKIAWFKLWNDSISTMNPEDGARQEFDKWKKNLGKFLKKAEENR